MMWLIGVCLKGKPVNLLIYFPFYVKSQTSDTARSLPNLSAGDKVCLHTDPFSPEATR